VTVNTFDGIANAGIIDGKTELEAEESVLVTVVTGVATIVSGLDGSISETTILSVGDTTDTLKDCT
jgi:small ligand-binding sensory domain FIST